MLSRARRGATAAAAATLRRVAVACAVACAMALAPASSLAAQQRRSPTDDVIEQMKRAINDLRYDEAIRLGRDLESFASQLRPAQLVTLRQLLALAWYPEEPEAQHADSALRQLAALVRIRPEAALPVEFRWAGLDSLLGVARDRTFGFSAAPDPEYQLAGVEASGTVGIFATRAAFVRMALVHRASGRLIPQDSGLARDRSSVRLRAHADGVLLIEPGEYDLRLVAVDSRTRDSIVVVRRATATAPAVTLQPIPALDSARLKPERVAPDRKRTIVTGALAALATAAIGSSIRGGGTLARDFAADPRAGGVAGLVLLGSVGIAMTEKGRAIPENVRANDVVRAQHAERVAAARAENARRLGAHRVTLRIAPEDR